MWTYAYIRISLSTHTSYHLITLAFKHSLWVCEHPIVWAHQPQNIYIYIYHHSSVCTYGYRHIELMNNFYKGVTLNWICEHLSMRVYKNVSLRVWEHGLIKAYEHESVGLLKHVSMGTCDRQSKWAWEHVVIKAC